MKKLQRGISAASIAFAIAIAGISSASAKTNEKHVFSSSVAYKTVKVDGLDIFYREAGDPSKPAVLLLHGYPSSSFMFRDLIPKLLEKYHVVAPDYPGFGQSSMPRVNEFEYTFENLTNVIDKFTQTIGLNRYSIYVQDYGSPVGFRLAVKHPERIEAIIIQNGNAYEIGLSENAAPLKAYGETGDKKVEQVLTDLMEPAGTKFQYIHGAHDASRLSPDTWTLDQARLERNGNQAIQLALFKDYVNNIRQYDAWHEYFRKYQPPTLVVWGKNDPFFLVAGVEEGFKKDLKDIEVNYYDGGHFALEEYSTEIAERINSFLSRKVKK